MFTFKKVITPFLLPPGVFIIIFFFTGVWLLSKKKSKIGIVLLLSGCLFWALSINPISDSMIKGLEYEYNLPKDINGDVIILLGQGVFEKAPDLTGIGAPSGDYFTRIVTAVRLQKRLNIPIIVSGREGSKYRTSEEHIAERFLMDLGISIDKIILEDQSRDTIENAKFSKKICVRRNFSNPILVTSAYHMKRASLIFRKVGLNVRPFPTGFTTWNDKEYGWQAYLPGNLDKASRAIFEYIGLLFYRFYY